jgi:hypothetical protein
MSLGARPEPDAPVSLRKRCSRGLRYLLWLARINWPPRRLARLAGSKAGRDCVILGNGPSLAAYDLSRLAAYDICVVNMGVRALDCGLPHATIHVVVDKNRYVRFGDDMELYALEHPIPLRFFGVWFRKDWRARKDKAAEPYFIVHHHEHISRWGFRDSPYAGYGACSTVVCIALQMLYFLGYSNVYVLGVDLDYPSEKPYFYELGAKDAAHEDDLKVQTRRPLMDNANAEFALARAAFERAGRGLYNAAPGGNLVALERRPLPCFTEA